MQAQKMPTQQELLSVYPDVPHRKQVRPLGECPSSMRGLREAFFPDSAKK